MAKDANTSACSHPRLDKERILGAQTGDYVCTSCHETFSPDQAKRIEAAREKAR